MVKIFSGLVISTLVILLSFTAFYSIAYILVILITAHRLNAIRVFSTYLSRVVLAGLMIGASIMISGLVVWFAGTQLHPIIVIGLYMVLFFISTHTFPRATSLHKNVQKKLIDKSDWISLASSLIAPFILFSSFGISAPSMLQIANEGWDNGSHILMLQDAGIYNGYLYGDKASLGDKVIYDTNAYPQAWHLATADILNGFGNSNVFEPSKPVRTTYMYVAATVAWLILASFIVMKVSIFVATAYTRRKLSSFWEYLTFTLVALFFQMIFLWGSFNSGFSNFIGMLAYLSVLIASLLDTKNPKAIIIGSIAGSAAALSWFLPLPAILAIVLISLVRSLGIKHGSILKHRQSIFTLASIFTPVAVITIIQVLIFVIFSRISGTDQLNEGVAVSATSAVNGVFPVSQIFLVLALSFTLWYWIKHSKKSATVSLALIPFIVLVIGIYLFQEITSGYTSYYLSKMMGIALLPIGIFAAPAFVFWISDTARKHHVRNKISIFGIAMLVFGLVVLLSNQSFYGASHLLEKNTRVNKHTEVAVVDFLRNASHKKQDVIVMRADPLKKTEDRNGRFEMRVVHKKLNCAYTVRNPGASLEEWIERLNNCARRLAKKGNSLTVITSERTSKAVRALRASNITIIEVVDKKN